MLNSTHSAVSFVLQKCGTGVGTLPQLEAPVKQVLVTNGKLLHSNGTLPSIVKQLVQSTQGNQVG